MRLPVTVQVPEPELLENLLRVRLMLQVWELNRDRPSVYHHLHRRLVPELELALEPELESGLAREPELALESEQVQELVQVLEQILAPPLVQRRLAILPPQS